MRQIPIEPANHQRKSAMPRPVQVKAHGASSAPAWIAPNQPTLTQSNCLPFQLRVTASSARREKAPPPEVRLAKASGRDCQTSVTAAKRREAERQAVAPPGSGP